MIKTDIEATPAEGIDPVFGADETPKGTSAYPDASDIPDGVSDTAAAAEPQATPAAPQWNPTEWQLKYRGQTIQPKSREELVALAQKGHSYSQSMQELNQTRSQIEKQYGPYRQLSEAFEKDPNLARAVSESIQAYVRGGAQGQGAAPAQPQAGGQDPLIYGKLAELDNFRTEYQNAQADKTFQEEVEKLKAAYPDQPWDIDNGEGSLLHQVLKHTLEGEYPSIQAAWRDMHWDSYITNVKAQALKEAQAQRDALKNQGVLSGGRAAGGMQPRTPAKAYAPTDSYKDLAAKALADLGA